MKKRHQNKIKEAGYSASPLYKKLGLKKQFLVNIIHPPKNYESQISEITHELVHMKPGSGELDFIQFYTNSLAEFEEELPQLKSQIKKNGTIWISWYKKRSGKPSELTEDIIRNAALAIGLVDVKVCAIDGDWSALKLVYRLKDR